MKILMINCSPVRNGATAEIVSLVRLFVGDNNEVRCVCIDDYDIGYCKGCRTCHTTAKCVQSYDIPKLMEQFAWTDSAYARSNAGKTPRKRPAL